MDKLHQAVDTVLEALAFAAMVIHLCGLDEKPWAKRVLSISNDFVGMVKGKKDGAP